MDDPYVSRKVREERAAETARTRKLTWIICGAGLAVIVAVVLYLTVFSSGSPSSPGGKISPETEDIQQLGALDDQISNGDAMAADPTTKAADKAKWQRDRAELEKKKNAILQRRPGLKK